MNRSLHTIAIPATLIAAGLYMPAAFADEERSLEALMSGWGTDLNNIELRSETLAPGLHVIRGAGGAALASIGEDGVLLVDDQFAQGVPALQRQISALGGDGVDYVVNTHWHFDHADGNPLLGAGGAQIIAHAASRQQMMQRTKVEYLGFHYQQPPYPAEGLPRLTFDTTMSLHVNGQRIDLAHFGPAHTAGDAAVFFRGDNVVHVGDLYSSGYPYLDAGNGGTLEGLIAVCRHIADWVNDDTQIVSGHSPVATRSDLLDYTAMLETVYADLSRMVREGKNLDDVLAADVTATFDEQRGNSALFVTMAYRSLSNE